MPHVTVRTFMDLVAEPLALEVVAGRTGFDRQISSTRIQKPGLALAGHTGFVHTDRVQVLGRTEISYLDSLEPTRRKAAIQGLVAHGLACILVTKGQVLPEELMSACEETGTPLLTTTMTSSECIRKLLAYLDDVVSPRCTLHGGLVDVNGVGVLITGASGIGKSECALDLVLRRHRLVADDVVEIRRRGEDLVGQASPTIRDLIEIRGIGILNVAELYGVTATRDHKRIELHVELIDWHDLPTPDRIGLEDRSLDILGVHIRSHRIPVRPGRNLAGLIEVAARDLLLRRVGRNAPRDLTERIRRHMELAERTSKEASTKEASRTPFTDAARDLEADRRGGLAERAEAPPEERPALRTGAHGVEVYDHIEDEVE